MNFVSDFEFSVQIATFKTLGFTTNCPFSLKEQVRALLIAAHPEEAKEYASVEEDLNIFYYAESYFRDVGYSKVANNRVCDVEVEVEVEVEIMDLDLVTKLFLEMRISDLVAKVDAESKANAKVEPEVESKSHFKPIYDDDEMIFGDEMVSGFIFTCGRPGRKTGLRIIHEYEVLN